MKRWGTILCLCLLPILLFSACAEATAQVDFVANKDVKKIFDDVHTVGYILDDIRKVDFYKEMQPNDSYTKKQVKSTKLDTTVTKYYRNEDLVYAAYEKGGKQMTEFHLRSTHSNDLHRQLRPAAARDLRGDQRQRPDRHLYGRGWQAHRRVHSL